MDHEESFSAASKPANSRDECAELSGIAGTHCNETSAEGMHNDFGAHEADPRLRVEVEYATLRPQPREAKLRNSASRCGCSVVAERPIRVAPKGARFFVRSLA